MADKLTDMIDEMVSAKTFSLDALDGVRALKVKAAEQEKQIDRLNEMLKLKATSESELRQQIATLSKQVSDSVAREQDLTTREGKVREVEMREAVSTARASTMSEVFGTIFRNPVMRETALKSIPFTATQPGGYTTTGYNQQTETIERREE